MTHFDSLVGQRFAVDPPLGLQERFNNVSGLAANRDLHGVVLGLNEKTELLQLFNDLIPSMESLHTLELFTGVDIQGTIIVEDIYEVQLVSGTDFVIVRVMSGGNLDGTRSELHVDDNRILDDRDTPVDEGVDSELAVEMGVSWIVGMDSDGGITKHGFGTGGGNDNLLVGAFDLVREASNNTKLEPLLSVIARDVKQRASGKLLLVDLEVGECGVELDTPVNETVGTVDDAVFTEAAEGLDDGRGELLVHGKRDAVPVIASTQTVKLLGDALLVSGNGQQRTGNLGPAHTRSSNP